MMAAEVLSLILLVVPLCVDSQSLGVHDGRAKGELLEVDEVAKGLGADVVEYCHHCSYSHLRTIMWM